MPQFIPFVQFSAPSVSKRPGFGERLLETAAGAIISGAAGYAGTKLRAGIQAETAKDIAEFQTEQEKQRDLARNYRPLDSGTTDRAAAVRYDFIPRTEGEQKFISLADLKEIEDREFMTEESGLDVPGAPELGAFSREGIATAIQAGTVKREIQASDIEKASAASRILEANKGRQAVGVPATHLDTLQQLEEETITLAELETIGQATQFGFGAVMTGVNEARQRREFNLNYERDLHADAITAAFSYQLRNEDPSQPPMLLTPLTARAWLTNTEAQRQLTEAGWQLDLRPGKIDLAEWIKQLQTDQSSEGIALAYADLIDRAGLNLKPGTQEKMDDTETLTFLRTSPLGRMWAGGVLLTEMYRPEVGGWSALVEAHNRGTLPDLVAQTPGMIAVAAQVYRTVYGEQITDAEISALVPGTDAEAVELNPGPLRVDGEGNVIDASGEPIAEGPSAFRLFGTAFGGQNPAVRGQAGYELAEQFGLAPRGRLTPPSPETAAGVQQRVGYERYEGMDDPGFSGMVNGFVDNLLQNPADSTTIFSTIAAFQRDPGLVKEFLLDSVKEQPGMDDEARQNALRAIDALDPNDEVDAALLANHINDMMQAYSTALRIYNTQVEEAAPAQQQ
jgi:hypothetical protein